MRHVHKLASLWAIPEGELKLQIVLVFFANAFFQWPQKLPICRKRVHYTHMSCKLPSECLVGYGAGSQFLAVPFSSPLLARKTFSKHFWGSVTLYKRAHYRLRATFAEQLCESITTSWQNSIFKCSPSRLSCDRGCFFLNLRCLTK